MKRKLTFKEGIIDMITTHAGSISSKIVIGAITYLVLTAGLITLMFVNPSFPGLADLITVMIITSASLLGLTTVENIKQKKPNDGTKDENVYRRSNR